VSGKLVETSPSGGYSIYEIPDGGRQVSFGDLLGINAGLTGLRNFGQGIGALKPDPELPPGYAELPTAGGAAALGGFSAVGSIGGAAASMFPKVGGLAARALDRNSAKTP